MNLSGILIPVWYLYLIIISLLTLGLVFIGIPRRVKEDEHHDYTPSVLVIVPCRGEDFSLRENLESLQEQDYENYDLIAAVDSEDDPSVAVLKSLGIRYIISDYACEACSGKTRALSTAIASDTTHAVFVITDSDITAEKDWLNHIVSPLGDTGNGLSTTFPYFNPVGGAWSKVKAVWGIVGQSLMESDLTRFGWGGSLAFRRDLLDGVAMEEFSESVSDDTALSSICREKGMKISYSRKAQPVINSPDDFTTFFEWANRQTALSISATRRVFHYGLIVYISSISVFVSAIALSVLVSPDYLAFFIPTVLSVVNNARRSRRIFPSLIPISIAIPFLFLANLLIANSMDEIQWRGRTYRLQKEKL